MFDPCEFRALTRLDEATIEAWRDAGWLRPDDEGGIPAYAEVDVARAQLIRDLRDDFGINDAGVSMVLDLIDQLYGLRRTLRDLLAGLGAEPDATRLRILAYLQKTTTSGS
jgi:chaperone modulatory protein CbpM